MKSFALVAALAGLAAADGQRRSTDLPTVSIKGKALYADGKRFYIRGIDYQPGGSSANEDPLADESTCKRDIEWFKKIGINTIRVYTVDNSKNHDTCMQALADAGIYLALDVNNPDYSLNRDKPAKSYNPTYLQSVFATIDAFVDYSNTLMFFSGNEVINEAGNTISAPFVKAVTRDMKQYIGTRGYRDIPVGYSAADVSENQYLMAQYMSCGEKPSHGDFYAINNYEWCADSSFEESGWSKLVDAYKNYSQPLIFSEYGCIKPSREFTETDALYQTDMTSVVSGGFVYEYSEEGSGYGLVTIKGDTVTPVKNQVKYLTDALKKTPNPEGDGDIVTSGMVTPDCPEQSKEWDTSPFKGEALPAMPEGAKKYLKDGAGKAPGLKGGSQDAPGGSTATAGSNAGAVTTTYPAGSAKTGGDDDDDDAAGFVQVSKGLAVAMGGLWAAWALL
ncbi:glucanosyltransferase domain-containing protein [Sarocladium implicatum]|nr:glucanosyltransferase domain-containing protein [Sarocladium implicatum]